MCLPTQFLAIFLTLIGPDQLTAEPGRYVVHAETRDVHWVAAWDDKWCTMGPQIDRMERIAALRLD
jgi:hypothetical protein